MCLVYRWLLFLSNPPFCLQMFLSKYTDESASAGNAMMQRRGQNQADEDNPPSPESSTMDPMDSLLGPDSASPAQRSQDSSAGLRFTHPMTPPSVSSNPHTPASPHASVLSQVGSRISRDFLNSYSVANNIFPKLFRSKVLVLLQPRPHFRSHRRRPFSITSTHLHR